MQCKIEVEGCKVYSILTKCRFPKPFFRVAISTLHILICNCESELRRALFVSLTSNRYKLMHFFDSMLSLDSVSATSSLLLKMWEN